MNESTYLSFQLSGSVLLHLGHESPLLDVSLNEGALVSKIGICGVLLSSMTLFFRRLRVPGEYVWGIHFRIVEALEDGKWEFVAGSMFGVDPV